MLPDVFAVAVRASSRASPLPQLISSENKICAGRRLPVGAGLLAMAICQTPHQQRPIITAFDQA
ncbi:hypothetical protein C1Y11_19475 [Pseudomonas sp. FW305-20]|nr:hypothetical protein C1Y11_19475 [Pseudomonas sp. FW305-20]PMU16733.1 hypothetical protein C1Y10_18050 [Pseudomonas sp. FW305-122]PMU37709.1 hypothetical protein C1Y12_18245 [Pseudomonas sp. FW305-47B]PMX58740.1 hypothetical protein C1Y13_19350 [Pseudomonas sp. FW305-33]PMX67256.1 hypothetical protein C1X12_14155 [Pseudomonas sp. FW305-60]